MENMWDQRYSDEEYIYGIKPNSFYEEHLQSLKPGTILLPGEGEGRNAVFAASLGWDVKAFDSSKVGKQKAESLAKNNNVNISYDITTYEEAEYEENSFDMIALLFTHSFIRKELHNKMQRYLKPGGTLLLEGFSKDQLNYQTGGPANIDMLFSIEEINADLRNFSDKKTWIEEINLDEGEFHQGKASVLRMIGKK